MAPVWRRDPPPFPLAPTVPLVVSFCTSLVRPLSLRIGYRVCMGLRSLARVAMSHRPLCLWPVCARRAPPDTRSVSQRSSHERALFIRRFPLRETATLCGVPSPRVRGCAGGGVREPVRSCVFAHDARARVVHSVSFVRSRCASLSHSVNGVVAPSRRVMIRCTG